MRDGEEIVQLYLRDLVASVSRPVKKFKDFKKISLKVGESKTVLVTIHKEKLAFYDEALQWVAEPGKLN